MQYLPLGNTGLYVSRICFGAMTFNDKDSVFDHMIGGMSQAEADRMIGTVLDAGVNFFDTANVYGEGASERMLGKALAGKREDVVIATKVYFTTRTEINALGVSRKSIMREVDKSLQRLGTDYIDLYQVHSFDPTTPLEETLRALDDCVRMGKVRYIGLSNFTGWQIAKADGLARLMGTERFCSVQAYYSLVGRELEREILPAARDLGLGVMVWSPLAGGFLSGKYTGNPGAEGRRTAFNYPPVDLERGDRIVEILREIAAAHDASPARVALAWLLHQEGVTSIIVGARKLEQLKDNLGAVDLQLSEEELLRLDEVSRLNPEYPHILPPRNRGENPFAMFAEMS
ncbi:MAG: aldo/keto reductase [Planctomycetota bacterium]|nr:MAG: aldo/keto reductase [Planctomycetota bacterium]